MNRAFASATRPFWPGRSVGRCGSFAPPETAFRAAVRGGKRPLRTSCAGGSFALRETVVSRGLAGFTLVEISIAVLLLAMVMVPLLAIFGSGNQTLQVTTGAMVAHAAALELIEQLMLIPFADLPDGTLSDDRVRNLLPIGDGSPWRFHLSDVPSVRRQVVISTLSRNGQARFKKVVVRVEWQMANDRAGARKIELSTLVAADAS